MKSRLLSPRRGPRRLLARLCYRHGPRRRRPWPAVRPSTCCSPMPGRAALHSSPMPTSCHTQHRGCGARLRVQRSPEPGSQDITLPWHPARRASLATNRSPLESSVSTAQSRARSSGRRAPSGNESLTRTSGRLIRTTTLHDSSHWPASPMPRRPGGSWLLTLCRPRPLLHRKPARRRPRSPMRRRAPLARHPLRL